MGRPLGQNTKHFAFLGKQRMKTFFFTRNKLSFDTKEIYFPSTPKKPKDNQVNFYFSPRKLK
jgi:hypothetical protein